MPPSTMCHPQEDYFNEDEANGRDHHEASSLPLAGEECKEQFWDQAFLSRSILRERIGLYFRHRLDSLLVNGHDSFVRESGKWKSL